jgi:cytochrome c oxidase cbb3-type subunit 2
MPAWKQFMSEPQIKDVVAYVKRLSPRFSEGQPAERIVVPPVPTATAERVARGAQLYVDLGCGSCHGEDGTGRGEAGQGLTTAEEDPISPRDLTDKWSFRGGHAPQDVFMRFSTGLDGSPMPSYRGMVSDDDLWDLVFYVLSLSPAERPPAAVGPG